MPKWAQEHEYSEDGVDLTLIRLMLSLTPEERLQAVEHHANEILELRESFMSSTQVGLTPCQHSEFAKFFGQGFPTAIRNDRAPLTHHEIWTAR